MKDFETLLRKFLKALGFVVVYEDIDQVPEEEFAQIRMSGMGASDSSKLLEVSPFPNSSLEDLIKEKVTGAWDESIGKKGSVRMGKELEPLVIEKTQNILREAFQKDEDDPFALYVYKPRHMYGDLNNHLNVNFDGILFNDLEIEYPVEIKVCTMFGRKYYNWDRSEVYEVDGELQLDRVDSREIFTSTEENIQEYCKQAADYYGIPVYYFTQIQQQLLFLNKPYGYISVLDQHNWNMHLFKVYSHPKVQNALMDTARTAWHKVEVKKAMREPGNARAAQIEGEDF